MKPDGAVSALIGGIDYQDIGVQPRHPGAPPARFGLQAFRLSGGAGRRHLALGRTRRRGGRHQRLSAPAISAANIYGTLTLADALAHSVNTITVNLAQEVGVKNVVAAAQRLGITSPLEANAVAGAGHQRSDAAGIDRGLCRLRQWRLSASIPISSPRSMIRAAKSITAARTPHATACDRRFRQSRHAGDAVECDRGRHRR